MAGSIKPPWYDEKTDRKHGWCYDICISKHNGTFMEFPFWDSVANMEKGANPDDYAILSCLSSEMHCPDTFERFCSEFVYDYYSTKAKDTFDKVLSFSREIQEFFTEEELSDLSKIS